MGQPPFRETLPNSFRSYFRIGTNVRAYLTCENLRRRRYLSVSDSSNPAIQSLYILATDGNENCENQANEMISETTRT
jgi:hypothetical protein